MKFLNPFGSSDDSSFLNERWAPYRARLRIQDRAHTLGRLLSRLILRRALAIIIIHKKKKNSNIIYLHFLFSGMKTGKEITHDFVMPV